MIDYCYYRRLITFKLKKNNLINNDSTSLVIDNYDNNNDSTTNDVESLLVKLLDDSYYNISANFKIISMDGSNVYPFIFMIAKINELDLITLNDNVINGSYIMNTEKKIIGLIYKIRKNDIIIIPSITINNYINNKNLKNIVLNNYLIKMRKIYDKSEIISIDDILLIDNNILYNNIIIPYNTYLWYSKNDIVELKFLNNLKVDTIKIKKKSIIDLLSTTSKLDTEYTIYYNCIIYCKPNLLLFEWLMCNNIIVNSISLLEYNNNPYKKKNTYCIFYKNNDYLLKILPIKVFKNIMKYNIFNPKMLNDISNNAINIELFTCYLSNKTNKTNKLYIYDSEYKKYKIFSYISSSNSI